MNSITLTLPYPISASPANFVDMTAQNIGHFVVDGRAGSNQRGLAMWNCTCICGKKIVVQGAKLRTKHTTSCGCMKGRANAKHGMHGTPTYNTWCAMKQRCNYQEGEAYEFYGARGITVCKQWDESFEVFLADMGERPLGTTLDRFPNGGGNYEPGNCRWATMPEQQRNRSSTIMVERDGKTQCIKDWCDELKLDVDRVYGRIRRGAIPAEALR